MRRQFTSEAAQGREGRLPNYEGSKRGTEAPPGVCPVLDAEASTISTGWRELLANGSAESGPAPTALSRSSSLGRITRECCFLACDNGMDRRRRRRPRCPAAPAGGRPRLLGRPGGCGAGGCGTCGTCTSCGGCDSCCESGGLLSKLKGLFHREDCGCGCESESCFSHYKVSFHKSGCGCDSGCGTSCGNTCTSCGNTCDTCGGCGGTLRDRLRSLFHHSDCGCDTGCGTCGGCGGGCMSTTTVPLTPEPIGKPKVEPKKLPSGDRESRRKRSRAVSA